MNNKLISAIAACTVLAIPAVGLAATAMAGHGAMANPAMMATMECRPATAKEHATAMMMNSKTPLECRAMHPEMMMNGKGGPDISKALSASQVDEAWRHYLSSMMLIPNGGGGG